MLGNSSSIVIPEGTPYAEEMRKHEALYTRFGPPGRPYVYREFPKMLFKGRDGEHCTVNNEDEQRNMQSRGFCLTQELALEAADREHTEHGKLAAERNWEIAHGRVSEKAAAEVRQAEAEHGAKHLPSVPETPVRRRRGPNKPKAVV